MNRFLYRLALLGCLSLTGFVPTYAQTILADSSTEFRWIANTFDPAIGFSWTESGFDDSNWIIGQPGFGYDISGSASGLLSSVAPSGSVSIYTRATFRIATAAAIGNLFLGVDYDDGWAVWINGVEVARSDELGLAPLSWNSSASSHESSNGSAPFYEWIDLSIAALPVLVDGDNQLAIGVWNTDAGSSDLVLAPTLVADKDVALSRRPYLQGSSSDRIVVHWRTDIPTDSIVECGTSVATLVPCASDMTLKTEHAMELSALASDTEYWYSVGDSTQTFAGGDAQHRFRTAPLAGTARASRIWIVGDSGTGDANALAVRDSYASFTAGTTTDLLLMLGDNAYPNGTDLEYQAALFDVYTDLLPNTPLFPAFGNHDSFSSNAISRTGPYFDIFDLPTAAEAGGVGSGTEAYYSFDYANVHFIVLDSQTSDRSIGSTMLTWLEADLAVTAQDWIIAYWHHPPYSKGSHDSDSETRLLEMRENVVPILEDYGVDLVFTGHSHSYERSYLIDGHYGDSDSFNDGYKVDLGDGDESGDGAYQKPNLGPDPHRGTVYTVAGNAGKISGGDLDHEAILVAVNELGSIVLDIDGPLAHVQFLNDSGTIRDQFVMTKGMNGLAPEAALDAFPRAGRAPLNVRLIDRSRNLPTAWSWDFEADNVTDSNLESPTHSYTVPGIYSVGLTVTNANGSDQITVTDLICVTAGIPEIVDGLQFEDKTRLSWSPAGGAASRYDLLRGDVELLRAGELAAAQQVCVASDSAVPEATDGTLPASGATNFYLVRARNCAGESGSYDSNSTRQFSSRDFELQGAGASCSCSAAEDLDGDGLCANLDNCPTLASSDLTDIDLDGLGDACDSCPLDSSNDADADGLCASADNCPNTPNPQQLDLDLDGLGDLCDSCTDVDMDGFGNPGFGANSCPLDNCPATSNASQTNDDGDSFGNLCDICPNDPLNDVDMDAVCGDVDNCPVTANPMQLDADGDLAGDLCDSCTDSDMDGSGDPGYPNNLCPNDNCPSTPNIDQADLDNDTIGDLCDPCPADAANDFDGDGICGEIDNCPFTSNVAQLNADNDAFGDLCDPCPLDLLNDLDGDFICGEIDNCPADSNIDQLDFDLDGAGDLCDADDDSDGVDDVTDCAPFIRGISQAADPIGNSLTIEKVGEGLLLWQLSFQGHVNNVYRAVRPVGQVGDQPFTCAAAETPAASWSESVPTTSGTVFYYLVSARNGCGESQAGVDSMAMPTIPISACPALHADFDSDGIDDWIDNCPLVANPLQLDGDGDFIGDLCD